MFSHGDGAINFSASREIVSNHFNFSAIFVFIGRLNCQISVQVKVESSLHKFHKLSVQEMLEWNEKSN
jgi:hypothetical protein